MADTITINPGAGGPVVATDDIGGVHHQRVKIEFGADGSATDVSSSDPLPVRAQPGTGSALAAPFHLVAAGGTNATVVKASAGHLHGWFVYNNAGSVRKLVFHNTASTPTASAGVYFTLPIPAGGAANLSFAVGIPFSTGIAITTVTGLGDADAGGVTANDLVIELFYA